MWGGPGVGQALEVAAWIREGARGELTVRARFRALGDGLFGSEQGRMRIKDDSGFWLV